MIDLTNETYDIKIYRKVFEYTPFGVKENKFEQNKNILRDIIKDAFNHYGVFDVQAIMICATKNNKIKVQVMYCNKTSDEYIIHNNVDITQFEIDINNIVLKELIDFWK